MPLPRIPDLREIATLITRNTTQLQGITVNQNAMINQFNSVRTTIDRSSQNIQNINVRENPEQSRDLRAILDQLRAIRTQLDGFDFDQLAKAQDLQNLFDRLQGELEAIDGYLKETIETKLDTVIENIDDRANGLKELINDNDRDMRQYISEKSQDIIDKQDETCQTISELVEGKSQDIIETVQSEGESTRDSVDNTRDAIVRELGSLSDTIKDLLEDAETRITEALGEKLGEIKQLCVDLVEAVATAEGTIIAAIEAEAIIQKTFRWTVNGALAGISADLIAVDATIGVIEYRVSDIPNDINNARDDINDKIKDIPYNIDNYKFQNIERKLKKGQREILDYIECYSKSTLDELGKIKKQIDKLPEQVSDQVSLSIVGESYYKWDSVTTYFPTLVFLFKEVSTDQYLRKSQIKVRLKEKNKDINDPEVARLRASCLLLEGLSYDYGTTRGNYVSSDKRFKTTVYAKDRTNIDNILSQLCSIINDDYVA